VTVPVPPADAFRMYVEYPSEWLPAEHTFITEPESITIEPEVGGRFYERGADGGEAVRGTVTEYAAPDRIAITWRVGDNWRPIDNDEHAAVVAIDFTAAGPDSTEVVLTYEHLDRLSAEMAQMIRWAVSAPDNTLTRYAAVVARHAASA
jgi:uncharacterized protein YndB with AHSA1/START domain